MRLIGILLLALYSGSASSGSLLFPTLSKIVPDCGVLEGNWKVSEGIKVDSLSDLSGVAKINLKSVEQLRSKIQPLGINAMGEYSCVVSSGGINIVTVKVFVFGSQDKAEAWWGKKYEYKGWEEHYSKVKGIKTLGVDSKQLKKRAILLNNIWITTHHIKHGDEHLTLLDSIVEKLKR